MKVFHSHKEIFEQNKSLKRTMDYLLDNKSTIEDFFCGDGDIVFVACGSSYWMSLSAHKTLHLFTGKKTFAIKAGDVVMCPEEYVNAYSNPVFLCPSRSGQTKELLDAIDILKEAYPDARVLSVTEYPKNKLIHKSDVSLSIEWANETSVCQTRSFSSLYTAFIMIAAILGKKDDFIRQLQEYLDKSPKLYALHEEKVRAVANSEAVKSLVTLGSGLQYGVVIAGAYIVIEMAEFACNYYQLLEYRHGPIVTASKGTAVFICSDNRSFEFESKLAEEICAEGGKVYSIANSEMSWADYTFSLDGEYAKEIIALHFIFVLQLFAYHYSISRNKNPDSPGKLKPFITY